MAKVPNAVEIAENLNRLSRAHERYRQTDDRRQTDGRLHIANVNVNPVPPTPKGHSPNLWPMSVVDKRLDGSRCHLGGR